MASKSLAAMWVWTFVSLNFLVSFIHVHISVSHLLERLIAALPGAQEWFLLRVNSKVVTKLAEAAKDFVLLGAVIKETLIEPIVLVGLLVFFELVNIIIMCVGHVTFIIDWSWIKLTSFHFLDLPSFLHFVKLCNMLNELWRESIFEAHELVLLLYFFNMLVLLR